VAVAGILSSVRLTERKLSDNVFVFYGAGEASIGMSDLLVVALEREGMSSEEARKKIWLVDSKGLIVKNRASGGLNEEKQRYAQEHKPLTKLDEIVESLKPTFLIGAAGQGPTFTKSILEKMAELNKRPVIFALSNPTSKAECTAEEAYQATDGRCIFASGSPFPIVNYKGQTFYPGQGNNSYIFPGVGLAIVSCQIRHIPNEMFFLIAAKSLADQVTDEDLKKGRVYPPIENIQQVSRKIAVDICEYAYDNQLAVLYPKPKNLATFIEQQQYKADYQEVLPKQWSWKS